MKNLPKSQARAAAILILIIAAVLLVLLALMNISLFFVVLILLVVGVSLLRMKKPELFSVFSKAQPRPETAAAKGEQADPGKEPDLFTAHIVLLYHGGLSMQQIPVNKPEFSIGRSPDSDFVLSGNTNISRTHAIIRYNEASGESTVTDHHSMHGTKLNGEWLAPDAPRVLRSGDIIQIEDRVLTVQNKNY